jgi:hypothetical protein
MVIDWAARDEQVGDVSGRGANRRHLVVNGRHEDVLDVADQGARLAASPSALSEKVLVRGRMFLLWWKALSGSYLALTSASRRYV